MKKDIYVVLDNIRSCENVGSIFRTADGAGVSKIYLCGITPVPEREDKNKELYLYHDRSGGTISKREKQNVQNQLRGGKIHKTALGSEKWIPWEYRRNTWRLLTELKAQGIMLIALEQTKDAENL